jgi:CRP-like cAMP-binding protein
MHRAIRLLLNTLSADDLALLMPHFTRVPLDREKVLLAADTPVEHVYFPESGIASIVASSSSGRRTEVGIFGRDAFRQPACCSSTIKAVI